MDEPNGYPGPSSAQRSPEPPWTDLAGVDLADMHPYVADQSCVKGLFGANTLVGIIGMTSSGKTFFCTHLALHIAANLRWRGRRVNGGLVIYAALEGAKSSVNRFVAARNDLGADAAMLRLTPGPLDLRNQADVHRFIEFVRTAELHYRTRVAAIFIDTLARAMPDADENTSEGMGGAIHGADTIRLATGATVFLVHHHGKDETRGARGHSSFKAALDSEIVIEKTGNLHIATVSKQRDFASGDRFGFTLEAVELGRDQDGDPVTTCVVREAPTDARKPVAGKNKAALLSAIREWRRARPTANHHISSIEIRELAGAQGIDRKRLPEVLVALTKSGYLSPDPDGFQIA